MFHSFAERKDDQNQRENEQKIRSEIFRILLKEEDNLTPADIKYINDNISQVDLNKRVKINDAYKTPVSITYMAANLQMMSVKHKQIFQTIIAAGGELSILEQQAFAAYPPEIRRKMEIPQAKQKPI